MWAPVAWALSWTAWIAWFMIWGVVIYFTVTHYVLPFVINLVVDWLVQKGHIRADQLSPISGKGIEFRSEDRRDAIVPDVRIERHGIGFGSWRDGKGLFVLKADGIMLRLPDAKRKKDKPVKEKKKRSARKHPLKRKLQTFGEWIGRLAIQNHSWLVSLISVELKDIRAIHDGLEGMELPVGDVTIALSIMFDSMVDTARETASPIASSPSMDFKRDHPLELSPPPSPVVFTSFVNPFVPDTPAVSPISPSDTTAAGFARAPRARRTAATLQYIKGVSHTAGHVWSRILGRAQGSLLVTVTVSDASLIRPHNSAPPPSARPSISDLKAEHDGLAHRRSRTSINSARLSFPNLRTPPPSASFKDMFRRSRPRYLTTSEEGYDELFRSAGTSRMTIGIGFSANKGLLGEDTLSVKVELADVTTTLAAVDQVKELWTAYKKRKDALAGPAEEKQEVPDWKPSSFKRMVLRAFESVSVEVQKASLLHHLPKPSSAASPDDLEEDYPSLSDNYTLSLDVTGLAVKLSAADASNNERAKNAFGTNNSPSSRVRGVGVALSWSDIGAHCIAPGESEKEKNQLVAIRQGELEALSTWRPTGWSREELLFANDPNIALIVGRIGIASTATAVDIQLLGELFAAWKDTRKSTPLASPNPNKGSSPAGLPPRVRMVVDVGPSSIIIADRFSDQRATVSIDSEGCHFGCFTSFEETIGRRRDFGGHRKAFEEEEALRQRREAAKEEYNPTLPAALIKPQFRRVATFEKAALQEDLGMRMKFEGNCKIEPASVGLSLGDIHAKNERTFNLALVEEIHGSIAGMVLGPTEISPEGVDVSRLDWSTFASDIGFGVSQRINIDLSEPAVVDALAAMGKQYRQNAAAPAEQEQAGSSKSVLDKLPSGLSARVSLGLVSVLVAHTDPNPNCEQKLVRGMIVQCKPVWEYAYYTRQTQCSRDRASTAHSAQRQSLHLPEDIANQAIAFYTQLCAGEGRAALSSVTVSELRIKPIWNVQRFNKMKGGGVGCELKDDPKPISRETLHEPGWMFRQGKAASNEQVLFGEFANNVPPFTYSTQEQSKRLLYNCSEIKINLLLRQDRPNGRIGLKVTSRMRRTVIIGDMMHVYCGLVAGLAVQKVLQGWKSPSKSASPPTLPFEVSVNVKLPTLAAQFAFPLGEHIILDINGIDCNHIPGAGLLCTADKILQLVPSPNEKGAWEELGRMKAFRLASVPQPSNVKFEASADAFRIRIPFGYQLAILILNINVTIKATKRLLSNFKHGEFNLRHEPCPEEPKLIPGLRLCFPRVVLEAVDDPLESQLNLIFRAGKTEQARRIAVEDLFEEKLRLLALPEGINSDDSLNEEKGKKVPKLTRQATVPVEEARERLDWYNARTWTKRMTSAQAERRRRESEKTRPFHSSASSLMIRILPHTPTPPLFRISLEDVDIELSSLDWSRDAIIDYMAKTSTPFDDGVEFALMVPVMLKWTMGCVSATLRDYPLPLLSIQLSGRTDTPAWTFETPFIIAEEYHGPDTWFSVPTEILPPHLGAEDAAPLRLEVFKTITPVKTYTRPMITIRSDRTTEFTWGNSYQPAIQDLMRVIDSITSPPKDISDKPGFWDKFRLNLHWIIQIDVAGPVHLHLKGSYDPYAIKGHAAGFAWAWRHGTKFLIGHPNEQRELIQVHSEELMTVIPDLSALDDGAAIGSEIEDEDTRGRGSVDSSREEALIQRRFTKPCARFVGGVTVGFGFRFERTCRPWTCTKGCGNTDKLARRQCRIWDFKKHQDVILRNPAAIEQAEQELGHPSDSFEGFRSDFIHFSVSLVVHSEQSEAGPSPSSFHFSPKGFAHFFAWWRLFDSTLSLPIRSGKIFPKSPPPSKKFGRSLGTIKYRFDLSDIYLSHVYSQVAPELWKAGKSQFLGIKARCGRFRADLHQRRQERIVRHEKLHRAQVLPHKPFYAVDVLLDDVVGKGVVADFVEAPAQDDSSPLDDTDSPLIRVSELDEEVKGWYSFFDYIDADRKPLDHDPKFQVIDLGDCPQIFLSKRVKAQQVTSHDDEETELAGRLDIETTKFGHEPSHICYLGKAPGVGPTQIKIAQERIDELKVELKAAEQGSQTRKQLSERAIKNRLKSLEKHVADLSTTENRHMETYTIVDQHPAVKANGHSKMNGQNQHSSDEEDFFELQLHVHCPKMSINNTSRNLLYRYWYSSQDRKREEYMTSFASLRNMAQSLARRICNEYLHTPTGEEHRRRAASAATDMVQELETLLRVNTNSRLFRLPTDLESHKGVKRLARMGLSSESQLKAKCNFLFLKPQIALRSEIDDTSIVLLAVEEILFRGYDVRDTQATDAVSASVLSRNYMFLKGMQAFYPTEEIMRKERLPSGVPRGLDFLPLEIFLDAKNEATDYDRIVWKADAAVNIDKFNHLRLPRGMEWPESKDDFGMPIEHLRIHQDSFNIIVPRLTVSATTKHYTALYNVVTNLLLYQDPRHRNRSERIDEFILAFDRQERNPAKLVMDLFHHQGSIKKLRELLAGYEANVDALTEGGQSELFLIRNDLMEQMEQLFTVYQAIAVNAKRDDARASQVHSSRINVQAGGIAWHMLRDDLSPLVQLDIDGTLFSYITNKDGSTDNALLLSDLAALNSNADAVFTEVMTRMDTNTGGKKDKAKPFATANWSISPPVGGIPIVRESHFFLHPVRVSLEERVARQIGDYVFTKDDKDDKKEKKDKSNNVPRLEVNGRPELSRVNSSNTEFAPLTRSKSSTSIVSQATSGSRSVSTPMPQQGKGDEKFTMVPSEDAKIMRQRASRTRVFGRIQVAKTTISLSYRGDDSRKHSGWKLPDCSDFKVNTPDLLYFNKVWEYKDIFDAVKIDFRSHAWSQTGDFISQIVKKTSLFRPKKTLNHHLGSSRDLPARLTQPPSRLRYNIENPTPLDEVSTDKENVLARVISRRSSRGAAEPSSPVSRVASLGSEAAAQAYMVPTPVNEREELDSGESSEEEVRMGKVKGFLGRLGRKKEARDMSSDDLHTSASHNKHSRTSSASISPRAHGYHSST